MTDGTIAEEQEFQSQWQEQRRRRRRRILLIVGSVVLLLIALPLLAGFIYDRYWQHKLDAEVSALRAQGKLLTFQQMLDRDKDLPAEQNSALIYLDAFSQMKDLPQSDLAQRLMGEDDFGARPSGGILDMLRSEAEAQAQGLKTILSAAPLKEGCYPLKPAPTPWDLDMSHCSQLRQAAKLCARMALFQAASARPAQATPYLMAGFGSASSLGGKACLIEGLVRIAADTITVDALEHCQALCQFTPEHVQTLKTQITREENELSLGPALVFERSAARYTFEQLVGNRQSMAVLGSALGGASPTAVYRWVPGWRQKDELFYDRTMDETERIRALPSRQALADIRHLGDSLPAELRKPFPPVIISAMLLPAISRTLQEEVRATVQLSVAAAALAAEQFRLKNGPWPDALDQLVPEFLDAVPEDYFGPGKVQYKRTKTGVLLYSIGPDGHDDGGVSQQEAGHADAYDLPFRLLDPELRGARTMTFRDEVMGAHVSLDDLKAAGLDEEALKRLGLSEDDLEALR